MLLKILIFAFCLFLERIVNTRKSSSCYMPPKCGWYDYQKSSIKANLYCNDLYAQLDLTRLAEQNSSSNTICKPTYTKLLNEINIHFNYRRSLFNRRQFVLNNSFQLLRNTRYLREILDNDYVDFKFNFYNLKGIQIDLMISIDDYIKNQTVQRYFVFVDVDFNIFSRNGTHLATCEEFQDTTEAELNTRNVFWEIWENEDGEVIEDLMKIENSRFSSKNPICPLLFSNAYLQTFEISGMIRYLN